MEKILEKLRSMCYNPQRRKNNDVYLLFYSTSIGYKRSLGLGQFYPSLGSYFEYSRRAQNIFGRTNQRVRKNRQNNSRSKRGPDKTSVKISLPKIVINSSVYFTAAKSPYGNSGKLIVLARRKKLKSLYPIIF